MVHIYFSLGILAGAYPSGTVVMIGELYGAESKSQVYGHLHTFLQENEAETKSIGNIPATSAKPIRCKIKL